MTITALGIDLAKNVFQLHGIDERGHAVVRKKVARAQLMSFVAQLPPIQIGMESCSSASFWAREFQKLGHEVKIIAPQFVKPFVKSNKNDSADAEAICEAMLRPHMRFVAMKSIAQQDIQSLHRVRSRRVAARTALANEIRGLLSEYGLILPVGIAKLRGGLMELLEKGVAQGRISPQGRHLFEEMQAELRDLDQKILASDEKIRGIFQSSSDCQRISEIPGIGPITATAILAAVSSPHSFRSAREFSAWVGLVPRQHSSGGKEKLLGISKRGDVYLRTLLIHGARSSLRHLDRYPEGPRKVWLEKLVARRGKNRATVALANKNARVVWVLLSRHEEVFKAAV